VAEDQRNVHHELVSAGWARMVPHAPEAVLPSHPTLVSGINDQCVLVETESPERRGDFAGAIVATAYFGGHSANLAGAVGGFLVVELPGVHSVAREAPERLVHVISSVAIPRGIPQQVP